MGQKMSRWGVGPIFALLSVGYGFIIWFVNHQFYPLFQIKIIPIVFLNILAIILIIIGVPFWIISLATVMRAYNSNKLVTDGAFKWCRHPVYAAWTIFFVPGIVISFKSWIDLTVPIFMYVLLLKLVKKEETYLENIFGAEYLDYKKNVPCILPYGCLKK